MKRGHLATVDGRRGRMRDVRRLLGIFPNVATALSVVMCVAVGAAWWASYSTYIATSFNPDLSPPRILEIENGNVSYGRTIFYGAGWNGLVVQNYPLRTRCATLFAWAAAIPLSRFVLLCVRGGLAFYARHLAPRPGHCRACGYDLRATPGRCPECGAVPNAQDARPGGADG